MTMLRVGLGQLAPGLGLLDENLAAHARVIDEAHDAGVNLLVFPELGLTGYSLQDLNAEVSMTADDPRLHALAARAPEMSVVVGFVEESVDHKLYIAAALLEGGAIRQVYRKSYLPNYGLFDEKRFFAAGAQLRAVDSALGIRLGMCICEDFWHLPVPYLLALDGAEVLINIASSPGRDIAATVDDLGSAQSWRTLMRAYAQLTTCAIVFVNRVGVEESVTFWGGSQVILPSGVVAYEAPLLEQGLFVTELDLSAVRSERISLPLLRDERPDFVLRQLERIIRDEAGIAPESATE